MLAKPKITVQINQTGAEAHSNKKKEASKNACREFRKGGRVVLLR